MVSYFILVPGAYTPWGDWEECSVTCGLGSQSRSRSCTDPSPEHGGPTCVEQGLGEATEDQACDAGPCPGNDCVYSPQKFNLRSMPLVLNL